MFVVKVLLTAIYMGLPFTGELTLKEHEFQDLKSCLEYKSSYDYVQEYNNLIEVLIVHGYTNVEVLSNDCIRIGRDA